MSTDSKAPFSDLSNRLANALNLESVPVGVMFTMKKPDGIPQFGRAPLKGCQFLDVARFEKEVFYTDVENHRDCKNGSHYLGFTPPFEGHFSGDWPAGDWPDKGRAIYKTPAAFRRSLPHLSIVPYGTMKYMVFGPLNLFPYEASQGGGVAVVFCTAKAGLFLARAAFYESGGTTEGTIGPATCSMILSKPLMTGQVQYTLGCFGFRQFVRIKPEEVVFGIPFEKMANVVENLELLLKRRPDLRGLLAEPVGEAHICTADEIAAQRAPGAILR